MNFSDFVGNPTAVDALRRMVGAGRLPPSLLLSGQRGVGKFTLALEIVIAGETASHH